METYADVDVSELILKRNYGKAAKVLRARVEAEPERPFQRQQLADVLLLDGKKGEALPILHALADEFARDGLPAKAIAVLKKIQRLDPAAYGIDAKLVRLFKERDEQGLRAAAVIKPPSSVEQLASRAAAASAASAAGEARKPIPLADTSQDEFVIEIAGSPFEPAAPQPGAGLGRTPLFSDLDAGELIALMDGLKLHAFEAGDVLVSEGEPGASLFILSTGTAKAWVKDPAGRAHAVRTMHDGDFFGEVSILTGRPRTATVTAATRCELLELDRDTVDGLTRSFPRVKEVLTRFCEERITNPKEQEIRRQGAG